MVVIDEDAAKRLEDDATLRAQLAQTLSGLFDSSVLEYDTDLQALKAWLEQERIGYRVFSTTVALRESKWSS
jgi:uncharacterized protein (TIGR02599 family)